MAALVAVAALVWTACGVLHYGLWMAYCWHEFPLLRTLDDWRYERRTAIGGALFGPIALVVTFQTAGCRCGLRFRRPRASQGLNSPSAESSKGT